MKKENEKISDLQNRVKQVQASRDLIDKVRVDLIHYGNLLSNIKTEEEISKRMIDFEKDKKDYWRGRADVCHKILLEAGYYEAEQLKRSGWDVPRSGGSSLSGM